MIDVFAALEGVMSLAGAAQKFPRLHRSWKTRHLRKVWGFRDRDSITVVCSELDDPPTRQLVEPREFIYSLKYGDLDAYVEVALTLARLFPAARVRGMSAGEFQAAPVDLAANLASAGETPRLCRGGTQSLTIPGVE